MLRWQLSAKIHTRAKFGSYYVAYNEADNSNKRYLCGRDCMCLRPTGIRQGTFKLALTGRMVFARHLSFRQKIFYDERFSNFHLLWTRVSCRQQSHGRLCSSVAWFDCDGHDVAICRMKATGATRSKLEISRSRVNSRNQRV